jgi:hypothetical protein
MNTPRTFVSSRGVTINIGTWEGEGDLLALDTMYSGPVYSQTLLKQNECVVCKEKRKQTINANVDVVSIRPYVLTLHLLRYSRDSDYIWH